MKDGDLIYDTKWDCFAFLQTMKSPPNYLYHTNTQFKMVCTNKKDWIVIPPSAIESLIRIQFKVNDYAKN